MKRLRNGIISLLGALVVCLASCEGGGRNAEHHIATDSLCSVMSASRYSNINVLDSIATNVYGTPGLCNEQQMIAANSMAYSCLMAMDYGKAVELYRFVTENSECEIERLVADVGLMTVCYRVSENRLFFDYRATALSRIRRINEEYDYLAPGDKDRFNSAKIEFCIVSLCYFSNLSMLDEAGRVLERLEDIIETTGERAPRLYARMMLANSEPDAGKRLSALATGLAIAENGDFVWLEANYRLLLAIALRDTDMLQLFAAEHPERVAVMLSSRQPLEELPLCLATDAMRQFALFGDRYMMIEAMAVKASCSTALGRYDDALFQIDTAYNCIGDYYKRYCPDVPASSLDSMLFYIGDGGEMATDFAAGVYNIPECLLGVCREASCAYAGIGEKVASDINREAYLKLLRTTRLNKFYESRVSSAESRMRRLRLSALLALSALVVVSAVLVVVYGKRKHRENFYSKDRKRLLKVSRMLLSAIPHNADDKQLLCRVISDTLNEQLGDFAGKTSFFVGEDLPAHETMPFVTVFDIIYANSEGGESLTVASEHCLDNNKRELVELLLPYVAVAIEEGVRLADIGEEREKVEEMKRVSAIYFAEHKRENLLKRVSVSVVSAMRPFIDRITNELNVLQGCVSGEERERKLVYVAELTERLEDLNLILERWIKTRQGELNLRVESFALSSLFEIIEKNRLMMEKRGLAFLVKGGDEVVKADRALTLFMINTLVDNAAKFTPCGGEVTLESIEAADYVEIAVSDTGIGLSQVDIDRIMGAKVYDASLIGGDNELLKAGSKGSGFGLMNCKGIIEKYKKTDPLFGSCSFDISSVKGKGSRFSFRLPKGVVRCMLLLLAMLPLQSRASDYLFDSINMCADSVFMCNVNGNHEDALVLADEALGMLNCYYKEQIGGTDTLSLYDGAAAELLWWRKELFPDSLNEAIYYNILDIRNEVAVASLALNEWKTYRYNNRIYSTLYRLVHEDKGIADRYSAMQQHANRYEVAIALSLLIIVLLLFYYVVSFVRHNIIERTNEHLVLDMNSRLLRIASRCSRGTVQGLAQSITDELYDCIGETMRVSGVAMLLRNGETEMVLAESPVTHMNGKADMYMQRVMDDGELLVASDSMLRVMPLNVVIDGENVVVGAMELVTERPLSENEVVSLELIMGYLASVAYHSAVRVASGYMALEELEEETARLNYEDNRLHVQNMVIDNCLSAVKHETVYYPSRIKALANSALEAPATSEKAVAEMKELMSYYSSVFGILGNCVMRELNDMGFTLSKVELSHLFAKAQGFVERMARRMKVDVKLVCEDTKVVVNVDECLAEYLFEQLLTAALKVRKTGGLSLRATDAGDVVRVELTDNRYELSSEEVAELFTPTRRNITGENDSMEYLVVKEIVRLHEDYTGKHGGRMEARSDVSGTVIVFTLPKAKFRQHV